MMRGLFWNDSFLLAGEVWYISSLPNDIRHHLFTFGGLLLFVARQPRPEDSASTLATERTIIANKEAKKENRGFYSGREQLLLLTFRQKIVNCFMFRCT